MKPTGMRKLLAVGLVLTALATGLTRPAQAAAERLTVTNSGTFTMNLLGSAGTAALGPATDSTATLTFTKGGGANASITAVVTATSLTGGAAAGHDITLTVNVAGGTGTQTLISGGTVGAAVTVMSNLSASTPAETVTYTATSNASSTVAGTYTFTVKYLSSAHGSTSSPTAAAAVATVDSLTVGNSGSMAMNLAGAAGTDPMGPATDSTAVLNYTHTANATKSITAQVTGTSLAGGAVTPHDITLTVSVAGGTGAQTLITAGTTAAAQTVYSDAAKAVLTNLTVTYSAGGHASGTVGGNYQFTVTYTSV